MLKVTFNKERVEQLIDCFRNGTPIDPGDTRWSALDLLAIAGVCFAAAHNVFLETSPKQTSPELQREMAADLQADLHAVIQFYAGMALEIEDGYYDDGHEPLLEAEISGESAPRMKIVRIGGFKGDPGKN